MAIGLSSFPLDHITYECDCTRARTHTHTHASTDSSLIIRWHGWWWYNHLRWFAVCGYVRVYLCESVSESVPHLCVCLTPVTSMTLMAASCPVLTWRPWWKEERRRTDTETRRRGRQERSEDKCQYPFKCLVFSSYAAQLHTFVF